MKPRMLYRSIAPLCLLFFLLLTSSLHAQSLVTAQNDGLQFYTFGTFLGGAMGECNKPGPIAEPVRLRQPVSPALTETSFGNLSRNSFRAPGYFNSDFNAMKNFSLTERLKLRVGANFFQHVQPPELPGPRPAI
jgi:hypothetical protein